MGDKAKRILSRQAREQKTACKSQSMLWLTALLERTDALPL